MTPVIRSAVADDAASVARAHTRAWQVAYDGIVPTTFLDSIDVAARTAQWRRNLRQTLLDDGTPAPTNIVAEIDNLVVGFACVGRWRDAVDDPERGELWALYVHPEQWGAGAGYALMHETHELFRHAGVATGYLWVLEENTRARRFYERQGWRADPVTKPDTIGGVSVLERRYSIPFS